MADYTSKGIQSQKNERADSLKRNAAKGEYGAVARHAESLAANSSGKIGASRALDSAVHDYVQRNPNKVSANMRMAPYGSSLESVVSRTMKNNIDSYSRGGKVKKIGLARLHKGEMVLTRAQVKRGKR